MLNDIKSEVEIIEKRLKTLGGYLDLEKGCRRREELEGEISREDFWKQDANDRNRILKELKRLKASIEPLSKMTVDLKDIKELLVITDAEDIASLSHLAEELRNLKKTVDGLEFKSLLDKEEDTLNAIVSINAGAGGTEACDWAEMLFRMYNKWADTRRFTIQRVDHLPGEDAGIKNITFIIRGEFAYGYLKSESGVHRLVRISPFDSNKRRHTSFASVDVVPEIDDNIEIDIKDADLRIDTFRAGGRGGQHVNVTDSAVRITHLPTGIVSQCQNERSQYKNKSTAMKVLKSRIYEMELKRKKAELAKQNQKKKLIEWGSQIRSYVLHPYSMVKDHRCAYETSDCEGVLDGDLDGFMDAYLRYEKR
ncbi:MAG: peptide chain release factor 2 [Candidatus Omnitrophota bacterium]